MLCRNMSQILGRNYGDSTPLPHPMTGVGHRSNESQHPLLVLTTDSAVLAIASNGNSTRPHLFRTYDHIGPDRSAPFLRNPGGADSAAIWEVVRATSAVP